MDMNDLQVALPSMPPIAASNQAYTFQNPYPQCFSLPNPIIKYIIKNPQSPKAWKKLIQTCKYFYSKNQVIPVCKLIRGYRYNLKGYKFTKNDGRLYYIADGEKFNPFTNILNLWIYDSFKGMPVSVLIPKIYKFDLRELLLSYQDITLTEYQMLTSPGTIKEFHFFYSTVHINDDKIATCDMLLENLNELEHIEVDCSNNLLFFEGDTVKKMVQHLIKLEKLSYFRLNDMPGGFDFESFREFLMKNKTANVILTFVPPVSYTYYEMVTNIVKEIKKNRNNLHVWFP